MGSKNPGWQAGAQRKHRWKEQIASVWVVMLFIIWVKVKFSLVPSPPPLFESKPFFLWNSLDSSRSRMAGYVCSAFIGRCGLKKLKRTLLLFFGFIFSLELLHAQCLFPALKMKRVKPECNNSPRVKTNSPKTPRIISRIRYKSSRVKTVSCRLSLGGGCQNLCLVSLTSCLKYPANNLVT